MSTLNVFSNSSNWILIPVAAVVDRSFCSIHIKFVLRNQNGVIHTMVMNIFTITFSSKIKKQKRIALIVIGVANYTAVDLESENMREALLLRNQR